MIKPTPNPPEHEATSLGTPPDQKSKRRKGDLFSVCPDINTETLLANASEDLLSISAIAAGLADGADGSRRSVALALSRMADGVHLLVERALDHLDEPEMAAIFAKQESRAS